MFFYRLGGLTLQSSIRFAELDDARSEKVDLVFRPGRLQDADKRQIHRVLLPNGEPWLSVEQSEVGYHISFPRIADYIISSDLKFVEWIAVPAVPIATVRHLFLDQVFPMLMSGWGKFVLHASAVRLQGTAVGFTGPSGMGKSTLAAALAQDGHHVVTDDSLILEQTGAGFSARATYAGLRLWPPMMRALFGPSATSSARVAHYTRKTRVQFKHLDQASLATLRVLYILGTCDSGISIASVSAAEAFMELIRSSFRLDITNRDRLGEEFAVYGALARSGLVRRLTYPRDLSRLADVKVAIFDDLNLRGS